MSRPLVGSPVLMGLTMNTKQIWDEMTTDELVARLHWLTNEAPLDDPTYDDEYWDIVCTLMVRDEDYEI